MDEATRTRFRGLADEADDLIGRVEEALGPEATNSFMIETRTHVDAIGAELTRLLADLSAKARAEMERTVGRKVRDLQRLAARLPTLSAGNPARTTSATEFIENRPPPPTRVPPPRAASRPAVKKTAPRKSATSSSRSRLPPPPSAAEIAASLENASVVKPYSMAERYEPGDVIEHATFGRGRVERLQPRAMQVQFAIGVKSLRTG
jgi:hypothetical protein